MMSRSDHIQTWVATGTALVAICLAGWEGVQNRYHNRLMVAPRVGTRVELGPGHGALVVSSDGLGPAVISSFQIRVDGVTVADGKPGDMPWSRYIALVPDSLFATTVNYYARGQLLRAGQDYRLLTIDVRPGIHVANAEIARLLGRASVELRFCSIYGDQCQVANVGLMGTQVD